MASWSTASRNCLRGLKCSLASWPLSACLRLISGMAHHSDRTRWRSRRPARSFRPACKSADGWTSLRSDPNRPSTLRVQFDQADERDIRTSSVRPPATRLTCSILRALRRSYSVVLGRWRSTIILGRGNSGFSAQRMEVMPSGVSQREVFRTRRVTNRTRSPR
jgi:hypothetical protein